MVQYTGVHHPAFITNDLEKTIRFWRDLLGMRLVYTTGGPGERQAFFDAGLGNRVTFFEWPKAEPVPYRRHGVPWEGPAVFDHVAIGVTEEEMLWDLLARLEEAGMPVSDVIDHGCWRSLYGYDPNGVPIEFLAPAPGVDLDATPVLAGRDPGCISKEGPEPHPDHWPDPEPVPDDERTVIPGAGYEDFPKRDDG